MTEQEAREKSKARIEAAYKLTLDLESALRNPETRPIAIKTIAKAWLVAEVTPEEFQEEIERRIGRSKMTREIAQAMREEQLPEDTVTAKSVS
jgi:hypothetical protein